jgi:hypothetical protein
MTTHTLRISSYQDGFPLAGVGGTWTGSAPTTAGSGDVLEDGSDTTYVELATTATATLYGSLLWGAFDATPALGSQSLDSATLTVRRGRSNAASDRVGVVIGGQLDPLKAFGLNPLGSSFWVARAISATSSTPSDTSFAFSAGPTTPTLAQFQAGQINIAFMFRRWMGGSVNFRLYDVKLDVTFV